MGFPPDYCRKVDLKCFKVGERSARLGDQSLVCIQSNSHQYDVQANIPEPQLRTLSHDRLYVGTYSLFKVEQPFKALAKEVSCSGTNRMITVDASIGYENVIFYDKKKRDVAGFVPSQVTITPTGH
jgi:hypothetical protein